MDFRKIKQLIKLLEKSDLSEIEIHDSDESVIIRNQAHSQAAFIQSNLSVINYGGDMKKQVIANATVQPEISISEDNMEKFLVTSCAVGTFYHAAEPDDKPLVQLGENVDIGDILSIIKSVGSVHKITAERSGRITQIFVHNGQGVEFGQALFMIE